MQWRGWSQHGVTKEALEEGAMFSEMLFMCIFTVTSAGWKLFVNSVEVHPLPSKIDLFFNYSSLVSSAFGVGSGSNDLRLCFRAAATLGRWAWCSEKGAWKESCQMLSCEVRGEVRWFYFNSVWSVGEGCAVLHEVVGFWNTALCKWIII